VNPQVFQPKVSYFKSFFTKKEIRFIHKSNYFSLPFKKYKWITRIFLSNSSIIDLDNYADPFIFQLRTGEILILLENLEKNNKGEIDIYILKKYSSEIHLLKRLSLEKSISFPYLFYNNNTLLLTFESLNLDKLFFYKVEFDNNSLSINIFREFDISVSDHVLISCSDNIALFYGVYSAKDLISNTPILFEVNFLSNSFKVLNAEFISDDNLFRPGSQILGDNLIFMQKLGTFNYGAGLVLKKIELAMIAVDSYILKFNTIANFTDNVIHTYTEISNIRSYDYKSK
jgi:hypothetical protein